MLAWYIDCLVAYSQVAFAKQALTRPNLRMAHNLHKMSSLLGAALFIADDCFPQTPYLHAAWHLAAAVGVGTCNKLLEWLTGILAAVLLIYLIIKTIMQEPMTFNSSIWIYVTMYPKFLSKVEKKLIGCLNHLSIELVSGTILICLIFSWEFLLEYYKTILLLETKAIYIFSLAFVPDWLHVPLW